MALYSENDFRFFEIAVGVALAGGVLVPVNTRLSVSDVVKIVESTDPAVLVCEESHSSQVKSIQERAPSIEHVQVFKGGVLEGD